MKRRHGSGRSGLVVLATVLVAAACGDEEPAGPDVGPLAAMTPIGGTGQMATVGTALPEPLAVRLADASGNPIAGHQVSFVVTSGGGSMFAPSVLSNVDGEARNQWTLGTSVDEPQQVEARAVESGAGQTFSVAFGATPLRGQAALLSWPPVTVSRASSAGCSRTP